MATALFTRTLVKRSFSRWNVAAFSTRFSAQHEYIKLEKDLGTIGITDFAQNQLGDVVYVDLPNVGDTFEKGDIFGSVESVKAASDVYIPASGEVVEINEQLSEHPHLVNEAAMTDGWFVKIKMNNPTDIEDLMEEAAYQEHCDNEEH